MSNLRSKILGVGSYLPPNKIKNNDLLKYMDTSDEWIQQRTGIKERFWADEKTSCSDLALEASLLAIHNAGITKEEIDLIIFGTLTPDVSFPSSGCYLQAKLGLADIPAIDIRQQCSAFIFGLSIADSFIRSGQHKKILLVGSEVQSKALELSTRGREITVLFGDGAGAAIIGATEIADFKSDSYVLSTHIHTDGKFADDLAMLGPGTRERRWIDKEEQFDDPRFYPQMNGKLVFQHATRRMPEVVAEALEANHLKATDIDLFVFHQANKRINDMCAKQLGVDSERVFNTIDRFGNTTAATIPLGLDYAVKEGKLKPGMLVVSAAFGSGFTWGSAVYRW